MNNKPLICIVGPTASGKTALSLCLAELFNGEIVSADSMQIYKGMSIGTAKPSIEERRGIPHHMMDIVEPWETYSVARYVNEAASVIDAIHAQNKLPIVVGGTGLYISALAQNLDFGSENGLSGIREELEEQIEKNGLAELYKYLKTIDPISAEKISSNDKKRIIRAIEIYKRYGKTKTQVDEESKEAGAIYDNLFLGLNYSNREILYDRINQRVDIMLEKGLLAEAEKAYQNIKGTASQAIGHKEFYEYLCGNMSFEEAVEHLKMQTRRYAKRQLTWFRRNENINWILMDKEQNPMDIAYNIVEKFLN